MKFTMWGMVKVAALLAVVLAGVPSPSPSNVERAPQATVCAVHCDTRDPSQARQDTFPVADRIQNGRRISLHYSETDAMAWGSIDSGAAGDSVWLDRSWDGGPSWEGLLGRATIPGTWTGTRTLMHNVADPAGHRRGVIRACGDAAGIQCTDWFRIKACDVVCDGEVNPIGDRQPVGPATLSGRTIALHLDDRGMAWGTTAGGAAGDEVWLDRSWDEGASWPGGSSLGRTSTPSGQTGTRTVLYAARDPKFRLYGAAVRACGRPVSGNNGACTAWARPGHDRPAAAADALMYSYRPDSGWWLSSWWNSAVSVTTVMDWMKRTGRTDYRWVLDNTFVKNNGVYPAGVKSSDPIEGHFISRAIDDAGWWGLAWVQAYDLTGERRYLDEAVIIANYLQQYWDTSSCGGGIWWNRERTYKNAVTAGLYIRLTAALHNRLPGDTTWYNRAVTGWNWFARSGMINGSMLVNDGLTGSCGNNGGTVWSYNQGLAIGAALEVWRATGQSSLLDTARSLANAAMSSTVLTRNGVLTESCDAANTCDDNQKQFKGIFMRYLGELAKVTGGGAYANYAATQANTIWQNDRDSLNRMGQRWSGGPSAQDWRTQASALGAFNATP